MKKSEETPTKSNKKVGDYSEPGIHDGDERDAAGTKKKFDRGEPGEDKEDIIQDKIKDSKPNVEQPIEYTEPGFNDDVPTNASGKLKYDRAAPEENPDAYQKLQHQTVLSSESSQPNYVELEAQRNKQVTIQQFSGKEESEFLHGLVVEAQAGGWNSPIIEKINHRIEYLKSQNRIFKL